MESSFRFCTVFGKKGGSFPVAENARERGGRNKRVEGRVVRSAQHDGIMKGARKGIDGEKRNKKAGRKYVEPALGKRVRASGKGKIKNDPGETCHLRYLEEKISWKMGETRCRKAREGGIPLT